MSKKSLVQKLKIENYLNKISFNNFGVGSMLSYEIMRIFLFNRRPENIKFSLSEKISIFLYKNGFRINFFNQPDFNFNNNILLLVSNFHPKIFGYFKTFSSFKKWKFKFFHFDKNKKELGFYYKLRLNLNDYISWKKKYKTISNELLNRLEILKSKNLISFKESNFLFQMFIIKSQNVIYIESLIKKSKPIALITDFDRLSINSLLIQALNKHSIPTFTFIHGSTIPNIDNFVPFFAKYVFCWSDYQARQFKSMNDNLLVVGNNKFSRDKVNRLDSTFLKRNNLKNSVNIVTLVTNISNDNYLKHALTFIDAVSGTNWIPVIKIHQNEKLKDYEKLIKSDSKIILIKDEFTLDEIIGVSDFVLTQQSTVSVEAIIKGVSFAVFNPLKHRDLGICSLLLEHSNTKIFTNSIDLNLFLKNTDRNNIEKFIDKNSQNDFVKKFISKYLEKDSSNMINQKLNIILNEN